MIYIQAKDWKDYLNRYRVRIVIQSGLENHYLKEIYDDCCQYQIEINTIDQSNLCTFIMPPIINKGKLKIAVSTSAASPMMAKLLKQQIEDNIIDNIDEILDWLSEKRNQ